MENILKYIDENYDRYINELKEYLRIESISTLPEKKDDMMKAAKFTAEKLSEAGVENIKIHETEGHPLVYGDWMHAEGKPTVLIYGHYDVQPVDPIELWKNPPFEPVIEDGKIWARGATDDKGQLFVHIKSVEAYLKTNKELPLNVKFILEGEEEIGSENLTKFVHANKEMLKADAVLISDTSLYDRGVPSITYGLRGLAYMEIEVTGPNRDLHSGSFGGAVANPINVIADMISKLHDENGKITIPGFYDGVLEVTDKEKENIKSLNFSDEDYANELGVDELQGEKGFSTLERLWARPTLDCNGIWGGFTGEGAKTVIPSKAHAKISMRLVPDQDPKRIEKLFEEHIKNIAPKSVKVKVKSLHGGYPVVTPLENNAMKAAAGAMEKAFDKKTIFMREGGSIPVVVEFVKALNAPAIMMGLGLDSENLHSPNEHFDLNHFKLGIKSSAYFLSEYAKLK